MTTAKTNIRKEGRIAENLFCQITGASKPTHSQDGNAVLDGYFIAIAKVGKDTINQVRAVKYLPLVAYDEPNDTWYVVPAHVLVAEVAKKDRGQHGEIAFECVNLSLSHFHQYRLDSKEELKARVLQAIAESNKFPDLKKRMAQVIDDAATLSKKSRTDVLAVIAKLSGSPS
jgi:hypothetical protein